MAAVVSSRDHSLHQRSYETKSLHSSLELQHLLRLMTAAECYKRIGCDKLPPYAGIGPRTPSLQRSKRPRDRLGIAWNVDHIGVVG